VTAGERRVAAAEALQRQAFARQQDAEKIALHRAWLATTEIEVSRGIDVAFQTERVKEARQVLSAQGPRPSTQGKGRRQSHQRPRLKAEVLASVGSAESPTVQNEALRLVAEDCRRRERLADLERAAARDETVFTQMCAHTQRLLPPSC
jgi:hypothetical protein